MRFSPQRRAILRHRNFKKWSEADVFCTFSLENVLLATAACNFSTSELQKVLSFLTFWLGNALLATAACNFSTCELQKVLREWCVLYILTSKCVSRHNGVQFLISPLTTWLRTRRFNEPTFRPTRHTNHWKNTAFRDFSNIWRGWLFFLLTFALLHLLSSVSTSSLCFSSAFQLSILSEVYYLNFLPWSTAKKTCLGRAHVGDMKTGREWQRDLCWVVGCIPLRANSLQGGGGCDGMCCNCWSRK